MNRKKVTYEREVDQQERGNGERMEQNQVD